MNASNFAWNEFNSIHLQNKNIIIMVLIIDNIIGIDWIEFYDSSIWFCLRGNSAYEILFGQYLNLS